MFPLILKFHNTKLPRALFVTEPNGVLGYCHVPKVASTAWMTIFAEMNHLPERIITSLLKRLSLHDYMFEKHYLEFPDNKLKLSRLFKFSFVRHPFERLVSAFHDKFITMKQLNIMKPFISFYINSKGIKHPKLKEWEQFKIEWVKENVNVTFQNFVDFMLYEYSLKAEISGP